MQKSSIFGIWIAFEYEDKQIKYRILEFLNGKLNIFNNYFYDHWQFTDRKVVVYKNNAAYC